MPLECLWNTSVVARRRVEGIAFWTAIALLAGALAVGRSFAKGDDSAGSQERAAAAICYPVAGTGHILGRDCRPIGPLSPVYEGDTVVVHQGNVTVVDMRSGERRPLAAQQSYVIKRIRKPTSHGPWNRLREALNDAILHGHGARATGGSVRGGESCFYPDSARFAEGVPVNFQWCGVRPAPHMLRLVWAQGDTVRATLDDRAVGMSAMVWPAGVEKRVGRVRWALLDAQGKRLGGGTFEILDDTAAKAARERFESAASATGFDRETGLGAALLAASEHFYLW